MVVTPSATRWRKRGSEVCNFFGISVDVAPSATKPVRSETLNMSFICSGFVVRLYIYDGTFQKIFLFLLCCRPMKSVRLLRSPMERG